MVEGGRTRSDSSRAALASLLGSGGLHEEKRRLYRDRSGRRRWDGPRLGRVNLVRNEFTDLFIGQASLFPNSQHDDLIDAVAGALALTTGTKSIKIDKTNRLAQRATPW